MKKKKTIVINNPRFKRIRDNLRLLLLKAAQDRWRELDQQWKDLYWIKKDRAKAQEIAKLKQLHNEMVKNSICKCASCIRTDQNVTFNPVDNAWYCIECYLKLQKYTAKKKTGKSQFFP